MEKQLAKYRWVHAALASTALAAVLVVSGVSTADAQSAEQSAVAPELNVGNAQRKTKLADLYQTLLKLEDEAQARRVEQSIWQIWLHHGDPKIDALMNRAMSARRESNYSKAIGLLDEVIKQAPDYAEGWNQRATIRFFQESYEESLIDVAETLKREPNHFGALAGRAVIRLRQGKQALAVQNILEALKVNPHLRERHLLKALGYEETKT